MALGRLSVILDANIANFQSDLGRAARIAEQQSRAMQRAFQNAARNMTASLAGILGAGGSIYAFTRSINGAIDQMQAIGVAAKSIGMSASEFSALSAAAKRADVDMETLTASMRKASQQLVMAQGGNRQAQTAFKALGLDPATIKDANDLLMKTADSLSRYREGAGKTTLEMQLFGRAGAQLNAFLDQGSAAIAAQEQHMRDLHVAFGADTQKQLDAYTEQQKELGDTLVGVRNVIAVALLPAMTEITEQVQAFLKSLDKQKISDFADGLLSIAHAAEGFAKGVGGFFDTMGKSLGTFAAQMNLLAHGDWRAVFDPKRIAAITNPGAPKQPQPAPTLTGADVPDWMKAGLPTGDNRPALVFNPNAGATKALKAAKDAADPTQALRDQLVQLTLSDKAFQLYTVAQKGATDAQLAYASAVIDTIDKIKTQRDEQDKLDAFLDQHRAEINGVTDAQQRFRDTMAEATKALNAQAISTEAFGRIAAKAVTDLNGKAREQIDQMTTFAKRAAENMQDSFATFLFDPFKDGVRGMLDGFADTLRQMAANALAANIFGKLGAQQGGGFRSGSILGTLFGAMGAGHAAGGPVSAGMMYPVNERGPELLSVAGKDFLMMGGQGGNVTPNHKLGGMTVNNYVNVQPTSSRRTALQVAEAVARKQQLALARA